MSVWVTKAPSMSPAQFAKLNYTQVQAAAVLRLVQSMRTCVRALACERLALLWLCWMLHDWLPCLASLP